MAVKAANVGSRDAHHRIVDSGACGLFRLAGGDPQRFDGCLDIDYDATAEASAGYDTVAEDCDSAFRPALADQCAHFAGADVNSGQHTSHLQKLRKELTRFIDHSDG